jgi:hypothetical protein
MGPGHQQLGAGRGSAASGQCGADKCGRQHSAPDSVFKQNQIYSNGFKFAPNFNRSKRCLPLLEKLEVNMDGKGLR